MPLQLVLDEYDRIDLPIKDSLLEAWRLQFDRAAVTYNTVVLSERVAICVAEGLTQCLDWDLQPPTEKQMRYATDIARELSVTLSGDALRYKGSMTEFIDRFADVFKARRVRRSRPGGALNTPEED
ncbi:MAG TPA: hypothetical protein VFJ87_08405 [Rhodanobacteraceae bacterium]|nr:hypothetical protein [Rhodanobacteraceae bacterium]